MTADRPIPDLVADPNSWTHLAADTLEELSWWSPVDQRQDRLRRRFLDLVRREGGRAMHRDGTVDHLTASAFVFDPDLRRVVLVAHRKAGLWLQPGGHLEVGDVGLAGAALREAAEETGLDDLRALPGVVHLSHHTLGARFGRCRSHLDVRYAMIASADRRPSVSPESDDVRWWSIDTLPTDTDEELRKVLPAVAERLPR